ncbi:MAG: Sodium/solute symporter, partial [uncultured Gemmatimonadaceae bacterium]
APAELGDRRRLPRVRRGRRAAPIARHAAPRRVPARQPQPAVVGGGALGDGDAALGRDDDRHHGAGGHRRAAVRAVLLRPPARDGAARRHARAVPAPRRGVHRVRVPRAPLRRQDAVAHRAALPRVARHVVRDDHRGTGDHLLVGVRVAARLVGGADGGAHGDLH